MVEILTLHGPISDPYFPEFSGKVRSKFRVFHGADSTAPPSGHACHRYPAHNNIWIQIVLYQKLRQSDVYEDMIDNIDRYDTSNYKSGDVLLSSKNEKVIGKFKDELGGKVMS